MKDKRQIEVTWPDGTKTIEDHDFLTRSSTEEEKKSLEEATKYYLEHVFDNE